jgi:hypothetical protein
LFASIFVLNAVSSQSSFKTKLAGPADKIPVCGHGSEYVQNITGLEICNTKVTLNQLILNEDLIAF